MVARGTKLESYYGYAMKIASAYCVAKPVDLYAFVSTENHAAALFLHLITRGLDRVIFVNLPANALHAAQSHVYIVLMTESLSLSHKRYIPSLSSASWDKWFEAHERE